MSSIVHREKYRQFHEYHHESREYEDTDNPISPTSERGLVRVKRPEEIQTLTMNHYDNDDYDNNPKNQQLSLQFSNHLDRIDRNWRNDPFWRDLYPRWAEPIFKEGIDVKATITNDKNRFAVDIDTYQFKPEELQVKTLDDTLLIEGRHEDVKDQDNFTKMYFVRKYQLPSDVNPQDIQSSIDSRGRLTVDAVKRLAAVEGRERLIPIEGTSKRAQSRSSSYSPRERHDSGRGSDGGYHSRQSNYSDRYNNERPYTPKLTSPIIKPADTSSYRRNEVNNRAEDRNGFRSERHREEYRSDSRSGYRSSSVLPPNDTYSRMRDIGINERPNDTYSRIRDTGINDRERESRNGYRVDTPGSNFDRRDDYGRDNRTESRQESVRSVKILRKTFE